MNNEGIDYRERVRERETGETPRKKMSIWLLPQRKKKSTVCLIESSSNFCFSYRKPASSLHLTDDFLFLFVFSNSWSNSPSLPKKGKPNINDRNQASQIRKKKKKTPTAHRFFFGFGMLNLFKSFNIDVWRTPNDAKEVKTRKRYSQPSFIPKPDFFFFLNHKSPPPF